MQCAFWPSAKWRIKSKHWWCGRLTSEYILNRFFLGFFRQYNISRCCAVLTKCNSHLKLKPELICTSIRLAPLERPAQPCSLAHIYIRIYHPWIAPLLHQRGFDFSMQGLYCVSSPGRPVVCCSSVLIFFTAAKHCKMQEVCLTHVVFLNSTDAICRPVMAAEV